MDTPKLIIVTASDAPNYVFDKFTRAVANQCTAAGMEVQVVQSGTVITGKEPTHMIIGDVETQSANHQIKTYGKTVFRTCSKSIAEEIVGICAAPPANKPHGPQKRGRGGKIRKW